MKKNLLSITDLSAKEILNLFLDTAALKKKPHPKPAPLAGKTIGLIFQKPSTRTSISFAAGVYHLGGLPLILQASDLQWRRGETPGDMARVMDRYLDALMIRAKSHQDVVTISQHCQVPVINGLTDTEHPCQALADLYTLWEKKGRSLPTMQKIHIVFFGDPNNMANSLLLGSALLGLRFTLACPTAFMPRAELVSQARALAAATGADLQITNDPLQAAQGADVLYTDTWVSMGDEAQAQARAKAFRPFQLNAMLLRQASPQALVMHCLPAHRGEEIADDVMDGPHSIIFDQAENRLHIQKAILVKLLGGRKSRAARK